MILSILFPVAFLISFSIILYPFSDFYWALNKCFLVKLFTNLRFHSWVVVIVRCHLLCEAKIAVLTHISFPLPSLNSSAHSEFQKYLLQSCSCLHYCRFTIYQLATFPSKPLFTVCAWCSFSLTAMALSSLDAVITSWTLTGPTGSPWRSFCSSCVWSQNY